MQGKNFITILLFFLLAVSLIGVAMNSIRMNKLEEKWTATEISLPMNSEQDQQAPSADLPFEMGLVDQFDDNPEEVDDSPPEPEPSGPRELSGECVELMRGFEGLTPEEMGDLYRQKSEAEQQRIDACFN